MVKTLTKLRIKQNFFNLKVNIILNGEKVHAFPSTSGTRHRCQLSPLLLNIMLNILDNTRRKEKKVYRVKGKENKIFTNDMTAYVKTPRESTKKKKRFKK